MPTRLMPNQLLLAWHPRKKVCHHWAVYRLPCETFDEMHWRAQGRCEICRRRPEEVQKMPLGIDHDHRLGNGWDHFRGLLCVKCNTHMKFVDNGLWKPNREQMLYVYNAWLWDWVPAGRLDEPWQPETPKQRGSESTFSVSPRYRRDCLSGRIDAKMMKMWPMPEARPHLGREGVLEWELQE